MVMLESPLSPPLSPVGGGGIKLIDRCALWKCVVVWLLHYHHLRYIRVRAEDVICSINLHHRLMVPLHVYKLQQLFMGGMVTVIATVVSRLSLHTMPHCARTDPPLPAELRTIQQYSAF